MRKFTLITIVFGAAAYLLMALCNGTWNAFEFNRMATMDIGGMYLLFTTVGYFILWAYQSVTDEDNSPFK